MNKSGDNRPKPNFLEQSKELSDVLPSPAMLESFEEIQPGMVAELLKMVQKEQVHRHKLEKKIVQSQAYTKRIGQLLVFALAIILIYSAITFTVDSMFGLALATILGGFGFLTATSFAPIMLHKCKQQVSSAKNKHHYNKPREHNNTGSSGGRSSQRNHYRRRPSSQGPKR